RAPGGGAACGLGDPGGPGFVLYADSGPGTGFGSSGQPFAATPWRWVGALLGLFATAPAGKGPAGTAGFTGFRITDRTAPEPTEPREKSRP
ncbi:glycoside hydrolase, partial [Streptomyces sp. NPDC059744]